MQLCSAQDLLPALPDPVAINWQMEFCSCRKVIRFYDLWSGTSPSEDIEFINLTMHPDLCFFLPSRIKLIELKVTLLRAFGQTWSQRQWKGDLFTNYRLHVCLFLTLVFH